MSQDRSEKYRDILISPVRECANYMPKFGHSKDGGFSLSNFQILYGQDPFYKWLGLDSQLMYSAHKAAGGITSIYRQIGIGCERLERELYMDFLGLKNEDVNWSYTIVGANGKQRTLYLDGRIIFDKITDGAARDRVIQWKDSVEEQLYLPEKMRTAINGIVFEVRQGYKSKDSKRQNADISNAANAYANGYLPCLMVISSQIDDDIVTRYRQSKWWILQGITGKNQYVSTFDFFKNIIGFDFAKFMDENHKFFQTEIHSILEKLMRAN